MFLVCGRQQHYFALLAAYLNGFLRSELSHLNSLVCPAMQLSFPQNPFPTVFVFPLPNIKSGILNFTCFTNNITLIIWQETCLVYGSLQPYLHKPDQKQQCQEENLHQGDWHHGLMHRQPHQQPLVQELLHRDHCL